MHHKRIERLMMFAEVAEQLSFAKAAVSLGVSKGHLSEQIKKLEHEYATPLVVRTTRSVRLTTEGQQVLASMKDVKDIMQSLEHRLEKLDGTIRITAPKMFAETFLANLILSFRQAHPSVRFEVNTSYTPYNLNHAHFDMAFRATQELPPDNMIAKKLFTYSHAVAASPDYFKQFGLPAEPLDLQQHQCLTATADDIWRFSPGEVRLNGAVASNDNGLLKQLALQGEGIIRLPDFYLTDEIKSQRLTTVLQSYARPKTSFYLLYPTATRETARLSEFTAFVNDYFADFERF